MLPSAAMVKAGPISSRMLPSDTAGKCHPRKTRRQPAELRPDRGDRPAGNGEHGDGTHRNNGAGMRLVSLGQRRRIANGHVPTAAVSQSSRAGCGDRGQFGGTWAGT